MNTQRSTYAANATPKPTLSKRPAYSVQSGRDELTRLLAAAALPPDCGAAYWARACECETTEELSTLLAMVNSEIGE